ncbi:MAG: hypothetical protein MJE68_08295, partial [Proteobacteria bacterium]|nr:hypothetical protein [Pseudomonadota bacterium]
GSLCAHSFYVCWKTMAYQNVTPGPEIIGAWGRMTIYFLFYPRVIVFITVRITKAFGLPKTEFIL